MPKQHHYSKNKMKQTKITTEIHFKANANFYMYSYKVKQKPSSDHWKVKFPEMYT